MCVESGFDSSLQEEDDGLSQNPSFFSMEEELGLLERKANDDEVVVSDWEEIMGFSQCHNVQMQNDTSYPPTTTPDLLSMFSLIPNQDSSSTHAVFDPCMLGFGGSSSSSLFDDERDQVVILNNQAFGDNNGVFEFSADMKNNNRVDGNNKDSIQFAMEKQRRVHFNDKFQALRKLIPNPSKNDRASIVGDAIEYINELKSTVSELKVVVEKKRINNKRQKTTTEEDMQVQSYNNNGRSSSSNWHHRKSNNNNTEVDVRIIEDEVTVKLVQRKGTHNNNNINNCLLLVSKVVDELHLDLYHVAGGLIGDYYSFLFNSKILEGTTVYASAIANMLIQAAEKHYCSHPLHLQANDN